MKGKEIHAPKEEVELVKVIILEVIRIMKKYHPKLRKFDSNLMHFQVYHLIKDLKLPISRGWFKHGMYVLAVDDALIEMGMMDKSQHQLHGNEEPMKYLIECDCHKRRR